MVGSKVIFPTVPERTGDNLCAMTSSAGVEKTAAISHSYLYCTGNVHVVIHLHTSEATAVKGELTSGHVELPVEARSQGKRKLLLPIFYRFPATLKLLKVSTAIREY